MLWSIDIGRIAGTVVRIHITFLLFLAWIFVASWVTGGPQVVAVIGSLWWRNHHSAQISDANQILAQARTNFESGDTNGALLELDKVLPQGEFYQPGLEVAAELVKANIAFASGEYENAISILTRLVDIAPDSLRADLYYQLSTAQESKGDYNGALQSLGHVEKYLGPEPDEKDTERKPSVWDRYYFQKGRIFLKMKMSRME